LSVPSDLRTEYGSLMYFTQQVNALGGHAPDIAHSVGFDLNDLTRTHTSLSHQTYCELLEAAATATHCQHFGLLLGQHNDISILGSLGQLTLHCSTLEEAATTFIRYFNMVSQGEFFRIEVGAQDHFLIRDVFLPEPFVSVQAQDISLYEMVRIARSICADYWQPSGVYFTHKPTDPQPYHTAFNCPLYFNQEFQGIAIASKDVVMPIKKVNNANRQALEEQVAKMYMENKKTIIEQTQQAITLGMITGDCSIKVVAHTLGIHTRTLHRKLAQRATSFTYILEETRRNFSEVFVTKTSISIFEISQMLGYKDSTSLSRSYLRWHGVSPSVHRRQNKR
jgi:AraC-like DNA-binding protein